MIFRKLWVMMLVLGVLGFSSFFACADTISVASGTTYRLDASKDYSATTFAMSGGTLDLNGRTASAAGVTLSTSANAFTNAGDSATLTVAGKLLCNGSGAKFTGGSWIFTDIDIGNTTGNGYLEVRGADTDVRFNRTGGYYLGGNYSATVRINGGTTRFANSCGMWTATAQSSVCDIEVNDGTFIAEDVIKTLAGTVDIRVNGGTFQPYYLRFGDKTGLTGTSPHTLTVNGGLTDVVSEFSLGNNAGSTSPFFLKLYGGVLKMPRVYRKNETGATTFIADGGTIEPRAAQSSFVSGFETALVGENGLTVDAAYAITVPQPITGLTDGASYGTIVKKGGAALTLSGALCDRVRLENQIGATTLSGASGAVRVTAPAGSVTLASTGSLGAGSELVANGGTITLNGSVDPTTTATVPGGKLAINVTTTLASLALGSDTTRGNLVLGEGVQLTVTGTFTGSLFYSDYDYAVTKDASGTHFVRATGAAETLQIRLDESGAASNATADVIFKQNDTLAVTVAKDSTLTLSGLYGRGALTKAGGGAAVLANAGNFFPAGVTCSDGRLAATTFDAFGLTGAASPLLTLAGGTVELAGGASAVLEGVLGVNAASATAAVIFKTTPDVTLRSVTHTQGALIKRGAGRLTVDPQNRSMATAMVLSRSAGVSCRSRTPQTFDEANGTVPTTGYGGFNVAEGEFRLANGKFDFSGINAMIGMPLTSEPAAPVVFTVTNSDVTVGSNGSDMFFVGSGLKAGDYGQTVRVNIIDSKIYGAAALCVGGYGDGSSTSPDARVYIGVTNSTLTSTWALLLNENLKGGKTYLRAYNSTFNGGDATGNAFRTAGYTESILDKCTYEDKNGSGGVTGAPQPPNTDTGESWTRFVGDSKAYVTWFGLDGAYGRHTVIFDNATWYPGPVAKMIWAVHPSNPDAYPINYLVKTEGDGVTIHKASDMTRTGVRLEGAGGVTKTGEGTFYFGIRSRWTNQSTEVPCVASFGQDTWSFTGPVDIRAGTLAVTNGALKSTLHPTVNVASGATWSLLGDLAVAGATVSGAGTVSGGTLTDPTVTGVWTADGQPGEAPTFTGTVSGQMTVDFGRTADDPVRRPLPTDLLVARCPAGSALTFRAKGLGLSNLHANFTRVGDEVRCTVVPSGFVMFLK